MPKEWERRTRQIRIGQATDNPRWVWISETFRCCDCPNCRADGHWFQASGRWFDTKEEAESSKRQ